MICFFHPYLLLCAGNSTIDHLNCIKACQINEIVGSGSALCFGVVSLGALCSDQMERYYRTCIGISLLVEYSLADTNHRQSSNHQVLSPLGAPKQRGKATREKIYRTIRTISTICKMSRIGGKGACDIISRVSPTTASTFHSQGS